MYCQPVPSPTCNGHAEPMQPMQHHTSRTQATHHQPKAQLLLRTASGHAANQPPCLGWAGLGLGWLAGWTDATSTPEHQTFIGSNGIDITVASCGLGSDHTCLAGAGVPGSLVGSGPGRLRCCCGSPLGPQVNWPAGPTCHQSQPGARAPYVSLAGGLPNQPMRGAQTSRPITPRSS